MKIGHTHYMKNISRMITFFALLQLSACGGGHYSQEYETPQLPCKLRGACDATVIKYLKKINSRGVRVITVGQDYLISIPAASLFETQTPHLKWTSYSLLNDVAILLKQFRKTAITVNSFSNKYVSAQREHALTLARARVVGEYLWSQGVDSRLIFTHGLGSDKPIMRFVQGGDMSMNARVEITFRELVV